MSFLLSSLAQRGLTCSHKNIKNWFIIGVLCLSIFIICFQRSVSPVMIIDINKSVPNSSGRFLSNLAQKHLVKHFLFNFMKFKSSGKSLKWNPTMMLLFKSKARSQLHRMWPIARCLIFEGQVHCWELLYIIDKPKPKVLRLTIHFSLTIELVLGYFFPAYKSPSQSYWRVVFSLQKTNSEPLGSRAMSEQGTRWVQGRFAAIIIFLLSGS